MGILTKPTAITSILTTDLNSLADSTNSALSSAMDFTIADTAHRLPLGSFTLTVAAQGSARSSGAKVKLFIVPAFDGTNYDATNETTAIASGSFNLDAATTARQCSLLHVAIPPCPFKVFLRNETGQPLAASGNILEVVAYSDDPSGS